MQIVVELTQRDYSYLELDFHIQTCLEFPQLHMSFICMGTYL